MVNENKTLFIVNYSLFIVKGFAGKLVLLFYLSSVIHRRPFFMYEG
jgi:hypothetical protein